MMSLCRCVVVSLPGCCFLGVLIVSVGGTGIIARPSGDKNILTRIGESADRCHAGFGQADEDVVAVDGEKAGGDSRVRPRRRKLVSSLEPTMVGPVQCKVREQSRSGGRQWTPDGQRGRRRDSDVTSERTSDE